MGDSIEYIQPDVEMEISSVTPSDLIPALMDKEANLSQAHSISTGTDVTVALIDTGVDINHTGLGLLQ